MGGNQQKIVGFRDWQKVTGVNEQTEAYCGPSASVELEHGT